MNERPLAPARNYPLLLIGQFLGAFGDNMLLKAILGPLTYALTAGRIGESRVNVENALFSTVFAIPFIVLAPLAGFLNDRMPKTSWLIGGNAVKVAGAAIGLFGASSLAGTHAHVLQVIGYTVVGVGACLYSPAKYGILPEIVPAQRLVKANGTVEMLTLVAIVAGLGCGGILYDATRSLPACYGTGLGVYLAALAFNAAMSRTGFDPKVIPGRSLAAFGSQCLALARAVRLRRAIIGSSLFWFAGSTLRSALQGWGLSAYAEAGVSSITNVKLVLLVIALVVGIILGSVLAGRFHRTGDLAWTRRYCCLLAVGLGGLGFLGGRWGLAPAVALLVATGGIAGLLVVPLNATLQAESDSRALGKTIAVQNLTDYLGIALGGVFLSLLSGLGLTAGRDLMLLGAVVLAFAVFLKMPARPA